MAGSVSATTVIAGASLALAAAGTAASVAGQMNSQAAAGAQANYMRAMDQRNQQIQQWQAADALQRGAVTEQKSRDTTDQRIGTQTATLAGQGTDLAGSPTDILGDTARAGELDAQTIRSNAAREAFGYEVGASNYGADASLRASFQPSNLGAGASLLAGASGIADKWQKFQQAGAFGGGTKTPAAAGSQSYGSEYDL